MKLSFSLSEDHILTGLQGGKRDKKEVLSDLLAALYSRTSLANEGSEQSELLEALMAREREMTTGLGEGVAFPHARIEKLTKPYTLLGISREGVDFQALDQQPVYFFVLSIVPRDNPGILLLTRAAIVRFLSMPDNRHALREADDAFTVWQRIDRSGVSIDRNIVAGDIMHPQIGSVGVDDTLKDAARALHRYHCDSLPILDEQGCFVGDISCYDLFSYGLPDFFANLHTISFVRDMDPFEKYFQTGRDLRLSELEIKRESPTIATSTTLMEIIFELATRNKPLLYVVDDDRKLLGMIDRFSVVDKILVSA